MKIMRRRTARLGLLLVVALYTFIMGVSAFYFYAEAAALLFQPNQSVLETTQTLTPRAAASTIFEIKPAQSSAAAAQYQTSDDTNGACENCIQDEDFGLCELLSGEYVNDNYGYMLTIPEEIQAMQAPAPAPNHGFVARLKADPQAVIYVDGSYNSTMLSSVGKATEEEINYLKEEYGAYSVVLLRRNRTRLDKRAAIRFIAQYTDSSTGVTMIEDAVISLRRYSTDEDGIIYSVSLRTPIYSYVANRAAFEKILKRWREIEFDDC